MEKFVKHALTSWIVAIPFYLAVPAIGIYGIIPLPYLFIVWVIGGLFTLYRVTGDFDPINDWVTLLVCVVVFFTFQLLIISAWELGNNSYYYMIALSWVFFEVGSYCWYKIRYHFINSRFLPKNMKMIRDIKRTVHLDDYWEWQNNWNEENPLLNMPNAVDKIAKAHREKLLETDIARGQKTAKRANEKNLKESAARRKSMEHFQDIIDE